MAENCNRILIDQLSFDNQTIYYEDDGQKITFHALGAIWTIEMFFYRPIGLKLQWPPQVRATRVMLKLTCEKLRRRVYVETKIQMTSKHSTSINGEKVFQNYIVEGDSFVELVIDLENAYDDINSINMSGELKIYVNTENYFYYKQNAMCFLPEDSKLQAIHLQMMHELSSDLLASKTQQEDTCDVVLRCESTDYKAHKFVLSARSKVFAAMFQHPMIENETNEVEIKEMSSVILKDVLEYIYSGKIENFDDKNAYELVSAAEQYDLPGLKKLSIYYIQSKLSHTNALYTLFFAKLYDEELKNKTIDYICMEFDHLKGTEKWEIFRNEQPLLANEVLLKFIQFVDSEKINSEKDIESKKPLET